MPVVAGIDSSTQSCKVVIRDAVSGALLREGSAPHPDGTSVDPHAWQAALDTALRAAGGLDDVDALAVAGQQHGMVCLDDDGEVVRDALLWNDTRSADAAAQLVAELPGGARAWAQAVGSVPLASFTVAKLRWLAEHEPDNAARTAAVCLPHDWLTAALRGSTAVAQLTTDRGDASGTGYWSPAQEAYRHDLVELALGRQVALPTVLGPSQDAGRSTTGALLGPGTGDNAAAALALDAVPGDVVVSIGTSGVVSGISTTPSADAGGLVAGFADARGAFLPLACTLNAARVLSSTARMLSVSMAEFARLALSAPPGADGVTLVPYLAGERTPNLPHATGSLLGLTEDNTTPANIARAAVEGLLCGLADGLDALRAHGVAVDRVLLVGGAAQSVAIRHIAPAVLGVPVLVPPAGEYVADGAARQAAWVLSGAADPPQWAGAETVRYDGDEVPAIRGRYARRRELTAER